MKRALVVMFLVSAGLVCLGAVSSSGLHFHTLGFSIQPLEDQPGLVPYQVLAMALPASDTFAPNVNVQIQPYRGTIDEYATVSKNQFVAAKLSLIEETKLGNTAVLLEYSGNFQGQQLHWYAKAISTGNAIYLATATATEAQWSTVAAKLTGCVDSFTMD